MSYLKACAETDLHEDTPLRVVLDDIPVTLVRTEGDVYAINDVCSHANVSLSEGEVEDCAIECWLHGSRFDLRTGRPSGPPANLPVPVYPVKIDGGAVFVEVNQES
ncbi:non-heme iron oxygenase ferredoxin subunit [Embleya sp. NPDC050154]|uniref:non-heme iron oxygenase ferredoxin subunit n=1 Tax=unclassified Embleya TaxID=2699296 RepID=UPI003789790E|nr:non-heme iron oxygenase ferredoxin subunit [Embleya sp. NBC_00888]